MPLAEAICEPVPPGAGPAGELGDRGHHGRHPRRPGGHRAGPRRQDGGLLPRAPRRAPVLGGARGRRPRPAPRGGRDGGRGPAAASTPRCPPRRASPGRCGRTPWSSRSTTPTPSRPAWTSSATEIAAVIMEPVMMNIGIVVPEPGYLERVRELCTRHGVVFIYDEVKCGGTIATGRRHRAVRRPAGPGVLREGDRRRADHRGIRRAGRHHGRGDEGRRRSRARSTATRCRATPGLAALTEVLTPDAYDHLGKLGTILAEGCRAGHRRPDIPAHTVDLGAKGCVSYRPEPLTNYRDFLETNPALFAASFPWMVNRGVFMTPGRRGAVDGQRPAHRGRRPDLRRRVRRVLRRAGELRGRRALGLRA